MQHDDLGAPPSITGTSVLLHTDKNISPPRVLGKQAQPTQIPDP